MDVKPSSEATQYDDVVKRWPAPTPKRTAMFLLLGAIVNVAVARACAALWIDAALSVSTQTAIVEQQGQFIMLGSIEHVVSAGWPCRSVVGP